MELKAESHIKGAFTGWGGNSVFQLDNGQAWKQSHYKYHYHYAHRPKVKLWQDGSKHFLEVEGMSEMIEVRMATSRDVDEAEQQNE